MKMILARLGTGKVGKPHPEATHCGNHLKITHLFEQETKIRTNQNLHFWDFQPGKLSGAIMFPVLNTMLLMNRSDSGQWFAG